MDRKASRRVARVGQGVGRLAQQLLGDGAGRRLLERFAHVNRRSLGVAIEDLPEKLFLVAEGGIKAGRLMPIASVRSSRDVPS